MAVRSMRAMPLHTQEELEFIQALGGEPLTQELLIMLIGDVLSEFVDEPHPLLVLDGFRVLDTGTHARGQALEDLEILVLVPTIHARVVHHHGLGFNRRNAVLFING